MGYGPRIEHSFLAFRDLSGGQHKAVSCVSYSTDGEGVDYTATLGTGFVGILENKPNAAGKAATVTVFGVTKAKVGGAVIGGNNLTIATSGWLVAAPASGGLVVGKALSNTASGYVATVLINGAVTGVVCTSLGL